MTKIIHNLLSISKTLGGMNIAANSSYTISESELKGFQNDLKVHTGLSSEPATVSIEDSNASGQLTGIDGIKFLLSNMVVIESQPALYPFAQKKLANGKKLKRRKHGVRKTISANSTDTITLVVPYSHCKIDEVEIVNCSGNDDVDLKVRDNAVGTFSTFPNAVLDQFGFDVCLSDLYYTDASNYDADLYQSMVIEVTFKNNDNEDKNIGVNFVLHEVI